MSKKYKDPLHIPSEELVVYFKGKPILMLNKSLLDRQNCWTNLDKIKELHVERLKIEAKLSDKRRKNFDKLLKAWTDNQFALQDAWGFTRDAKFHRFWDIPACGCPKLDNSDAYPTGYYTISGACKLHGGNLK